MRTFDLGEGAEAFPGPEVLAGFNPLEYKLPDARAVALMPHHPGFLLRWYPHRPDALGTIPTTPELIEDHISRTQTHLQAVRTESEGALVVPSHRSFIYPHPADPTKLAILTVIEKVEGTRHDMNTTDAATAPVIYGLARYLRWQLSTGQREILSDIFKPQQSVTGSTNYLLDMDGMLTSTPSREATLKRFLPPLGVWRARIPEVPYAVAADEVVGDIERITNTATPNSLGWGEYAHAKIMDPILVAIDKVLRTLK
jgi:hypothetical protein